MREVISDMGRHWNGSVLTEDNVPGDVKVQWCEDYYFTGNRRGRHVELYLGREFVRLACLSDIRLVGEEGFDPLLVVIANCGFGRANNLESYKCAKYVGIDILYRHGKYIMYLGGYGKKYSVELRDGGHLRRLLNELT